MKKTLMLIALLAVIACFNSSSQKRYGYAVLHFRCGDHDPQKDRIYYSPIIELNTLNFPKYTDGVDPSIAQYSVRYYNYAISKWFEIYLREKYKILVNPPDKYERKSKSVVYNDSDKAGCNVDKTNPACFFLNKEELSIQRGKAISESKSPENNSITCEVVDL
ncbi:MAG: hypothetical protein ABI707_07460 [Ferruginibacter sp.]